MREVLAYEQVLGSNLESLSELEKKDLASRVKDKNDSLATSVVTAFRWVYFPDASGLAYASLAVPATAKEKIAQRVVERLSSQDYGDPNVLSGMGAIYFNAKVSSRLWKDESDPLALDKAYRGFRQWTYLPILPDRDTTLRDCIREGGASKLWAVAIGDPDAARYQQVIETADGFDLLHVLFDGSASLVKGDMRDLIREELRTEESKTEDSTAGTEDPVAEPDPKRDEPHEDPGIPPPERRFRRVRLSVPNLAVAKTSNLQPYLFKALQEADAGAEIRLTILVTSKAGIGEDVLERRIVEGFEQLGITVSWEADP